MDDEKPAEAGGNRSVVSEAVKAAALEYLRRHPISDWRCSPADDPVYGTDLKPGSQAGAATGNPRSQARASDPVRDFSCPDRTANRPAAEYSCQGTVVVRSVSVGPADPDDPDAISMETVEALRRLTQLHIPTAADDPLSSLRDIRDAL